MHAWRVRGCTPRSMHAACVGASRQSMGSESEPQTRTHAHICVVRGKLGICTRTGTIVPVWVL